MSGATIDTGGSAMLAQIREFLTPGNDTYPFGTLLCKDFTLLLYWSPLKWNSAIDGWNAQPEKWVCLGQDGWWPNAEEYKEIFLELKELCESYDMWPQWPNESCELDEIASDWRITDAEFARYTAPAADAQGEA